jgi:serine protease Do
MTFSNANVPAKRRKAHWLGAVAVAALLTGGAVGTGIVPPTPSARAEMLSLDKPLIAAPSFADVAERVKPAVVSVRVKMENVSDRRNGSSFGSQFNLDDLPDEFQQFFRRFRGDDNERGQRFGQQDRDERLQRPSPRRYSRQGQGSGFFISADGYLVTNNHVVDNAGSVEVVMDDGRTLDAKVVGTDSKTDIALLKVTEGSDFPYVRFAEEKPRIGDWVVAVGNPFGLGGSVTAGIVSAHGRNIGAGPYDDFIQIDAAVNRGNSGGPTFNLKGEVVGVNTAIASPSGGNVGIAFAIPANVAQMVVGDLKDDGKVTRGFIGVQIQPVTKDIADAIGLKEVKGALVAEAMKDSPAAKAGIKTGDAIIAVDGQPIKDARALSLKVASYAPGKSLPVTVWRDGKEQIVTIEVGGQDNQTRVKADVKPTNETPRLGLRLAPAEGSEEGVAVADVEPQSPADEKGVRKGDVILDVAGQAVSKPDDVTAAVETARKNGRTTVLMRIKSREGIRYVAIPFGKVS